jgi:predicted nucleic acid-binding Zn ribbon protein
MNRELFYRQLKQKRSKFLGDAITDYFKSSELNDKYLESFLQSEWKSIVGEVVAKHTSAVYLKEDRVILKIESAPLRNELLMNKRLLLQNIKDHLKSTKIKDIVFV